MQKKLVLITTAATLIAPPWIAASAQQAEAGPEEIIVTARKRQESILKVPVIQTVVSQEELERRQVTELADLTSLTPGFVLGEQAAEAGVQVTIRGVGTNTVFDPGADQSISLNLDGLQLSHGTAYRTAFFDMQQVEILKGPQALFYGKSNTGGVVAVRTADPGDHFEAIGRLGHEFEADEWRTEAILSGPISERVGVRLATMYADKGSYFKNTATGNPAVGTAAPPNDWGDSTSLIVRGTLVFEPTDALRARLKANYTRDRTVGQVATQLVSCPDGLVNYAGLPMFTPDDECKADKRVSITGYDAPAFQNVRNGGEDFTWTTQRFGTFELAYDIQPSLTLTSVTGYYNSDVDGLFGSAVLASDKNFARKEFMQELRLDSDFDGAWNFSAGGFYQDGKVTDSLRTAGNTALGLPTVLTFRDHELNIESFSLFGQVRFQIQPNLELAVGARWTDEKRSHHIEMLSGATLLVADEPDLSTKNWSPEVTLTYTPTDDLTIFGALKQGYKSGSYSFGQIVAGRDNRYGDEKVQGGELGLKARALDRQMYLELAGYYYKYKDMQVGTTVVPLVGIPFVQTLNAGELKVYGVELDGTFTPHAVPSLSLRTALNWNHARFEKFDAAPCWGGQTIAEGCDRALNTVTGRYTAQDLAGVRPVRAPDWQGTVGAKYDLQMGGGTLSLGVDGQYSSKFPAFLGRRADFYQDSYFKWNANVAYKTANDAWEVALIGNNLADKLTYASCTTSNWAGGVLPQVTGDVAKGPGGSDEVLCNLDRGREVWLRLTYRPAARD